MEKNAIEMDALVLYLNTTRMGVAHAILTRHALTALIQERTAMFADGMDMRNSLTKKQNKFT